MKKLLILPLLSFLALATISLWFWLNVQPVSSNKAFQNFLIAKGATATQIGDKLQSQGLIKNALVFRIYAHFSGQAGKIPTGEFRLSPGFTLFQTIDQLLKGPLEVWVTIPEGLRREEIAAKFAGGLERDSAFNTDFLKSSVGKEGMLFPDTYLFPKDATAGAIVTKMLKTFATKTVSLSTKSGLSFNDRIILASILERETKTDAERPVVAGILLNRLNAGMALQVDATVQYAVGNSKDWWPVLSLNDLKIASPYNTYKFTGLPPTPISNPGISSINAAFNPTPSDYWYYIHDPSGQIHYAKTLSEQNANIAKYLH